MRFCIKKIYCSNCQQLVKGNEQKKGDKLIDVLCPGCGKLLYAWNGYIWRQTEPAIATET